MQQQRGTLPLISNWSLSALLQDVIALLSWIVVFFIAKRRRNLLNNSLDLLTLKAERAANGYVWTSKSADGQKNFLKRRPRKKKEIKMLLGSKHKKLIKSQVLMIEQVYRSWTFDSYLKWFFELENLWLC